jgi:hypothetical protein
MLIFDRFVTREHAENFARSAGERFGLGATVHDTQEESNAIDPFPFALTPPIVLVERPEPFPNAEREDEIIAFARESDAHYAGT